MFWCMMLLLLLFLLFEGRVECVAQVRYSVGAMGGLRDERAAAFEGPSNSGT